MKRLLSVGLIALAISCSDAPIRITLAEPADGAGKTDDGDLKGRKELNSPTPDAGSDADVYKGSDTVDEDKGNEEASKEKALKVKEAADNVAETEKEKETVKEKEKGKVPEAAKPLPADPKTFAASLEGFRWEFKCNKDVGGDQECDSPDLTDGNKTFGGDTATTYLAELRFRGVVEPMKYKDGLLEGERFYIGGATDNGTYNIYSIEVSDPKQVYFLNSSPATGHDVFVVDYKAKIKIKGGAKIHLVGNGQNLRMIANYKKLAVPEIDKNNVPFNGQYIQMNVVGVTLVP